MSYYVAMEFIQELKISANKIIELSGRLPVRSWNQEKSAPLGGFIDRAGFVYYDDIELFTDVYAPEDAVKGLLRARLAWVHKNEADQELFTIITLDFDADLEKTKAMIANSGDLVQEKLISLLNDSTTTPKYIQVSLDSSGKNDSGHAGGKRYEYSGEDLQVITEAAQQEFLTTIDKAYSQIISSI